MKKLCLLFLASAFVFACNQPTTTTEAGSAFSIDSAKAAIMAANKKFEEAMAKDDSAGVAAIYAKDGCLMTSGMPKICGTAGLTAFFGGAKKMGIGGIKLTTLDVMGGKELVAEEGNYELLGLDGKAIDKGKYIVTWKQEDGKWKIARDIANSDMPPPPPPPAKK